jgi:tRNA(Ile2) C34 agmatinyltransferase TiaS
MRKPRKIIQLICTDCGVTFEAKAKHNLRCDACRKAWANEQNKRYRDRNRIQTQAVLYKTRPKMSIREVIRAMEKYNRENHTHLTYGQYVMLMESGKL